MKFDRDIYFGLLCGGKVRRAVAYLRQFPEKASLAQRLERRMTQPPRLRTRVAMAEPGSVVFCRYYQRLFWQGTTRQEGVRVLLEELCQLLEENGLAQPAETADWKARTEQGMEAAEERVAAPDRTGGLSLPGGRDPRLFWPLRLEGDEGRALPSGASGRNAGFHCPDDGRLCVQKLAGLHFLG